jgi:hypothetical protein
VGDNPFLLIVKQIFSIFGAALDSISELQEFRDKQDHRAHYREVQSLLRKVNYTSGMRGDLSYNLDRLLQEEDQRRDVDFAASLCGRLLEDTIETLSIVQSTARSEKILSVAPKLGTQIANLAQEAEAAYKLLKDAPNQREVYLRHAPVFRQIPEMFDNLARELANVLREMGEDKIY